MPALVVAIAGNPASVRMIAEPASQAFGITKPRGAACNALNVFAICSRRAMCASFFQKSAGSTLDFCVIMRQICIFLSIDKFFAFEPSYGYRAPQDVPHDLPAAQLFASRRKPASHPAGDLAPHWPART